MHRQVQKAIKDKQVVPINHWRNAVERADRYEELWLEEHRKNCELAKEHSHPELGGGGNPIDTGERTTFFCRKCRSQWPCETFKHVTGKSFEPLKLTVKAEPAEE